MLNKVFNKEIISIVLCLATFCSIGFGQKEAEYIGRTIQLVDSLRKKGDFAGAWGKLHTLSGSVNQMDNWQLGMYHKLTSIRLVRDNKHDEAMKALGKARNYFRILDTPEAKTEFQNTFISSGISYYQRGLFAEAKDTLLFLENMIKNDTASKQVLLSTYTMLANVLERQEKYDEAIGYVRKSLDAYTADGTENSYKAGYAQNTLGTIYQRLGRHELARNAYQKAYEIFHEIYGKNDSRTQSALGNLAVIQKETGEIDKAIKPLIERLENLTSSADPDNIKITTTLINLGSTYKELGDYNLAEKFTNQALATWKKVSDQPHVREVNILRLLASIQFQRGEFSDCYRTILLAEKINKQVENKESKEYLSLLLLKGSYFTQQGNFERSIQPFQSAYYLSKKIDKGFVNDIIDAQYGYLYSLCRTNKTQLASRILDSLSSDFNQIRATLNEEVTVEVESIIALIKTKISLLENPSAILPNTHIQELEKAAKKNLAYSAKLRGRKNKEALYSANFNPSVLFGELAGAYIHNALLDQQNAQSHLSKALGYVDIQLSYLKGEGYAGRSTTISSSTQKEARQIGQQIAAYEQLIYELKNEDPQVLTKRKDFQQEIIKLEEKLELLVPIQQSDTALLRKIFIQKLNKSQHFFVVVSTAEKTYVIAGQGTNLHAKEIDNIGQFYSQLSDYTQFVRNPEVGFGESLSYLKSGNSLYQTLFEWAWLKTGIPAPEKIAVVISNPIIDLPLASLPCEIPPNASSFRDISFAVHRHEFTYHQTPSALISDVTNSRNSQGLKLLGLAPLTTAYASFGSEYVDEEQSLPYAEEEVQKIVAATSGIALLGAQATLSDLKARMSQRNVFHFATHASSNSQTPAFSYIVLADSTGAYAERLYARTIRELNFPADLVVLSACESGEANMIDGSGANSLASVFLDAGASNVINTLWRIDDRQSQTLMLEFYQELANGKSIDQALALAQRHYIDQSSSQYLHPYYWAAYSTIGNPHAITTTTTWWYGLAILLAILIGAYLFFRRNTTLPQNASSLTP